ELTRALKCGVNLISNLTESGEFDCIIDGIFGTGLSRELDERTINLINLLNEKSAYKLACDIPSGLDKNGMSQGAVFKADTTVTMGALKLALYSDFAKDFVGRVKVANLGLPRELYETGTSFYKLGKSDLNLPFRVKQNANKGDFGHVFVVSGQKSGAARIAGLAALTMGAGLVSVVGENLNIEPVLMQSARITPKMRVGAVGMGLGELDEAQKDELFSELKTKDALVIDADLCYEPRTLELLNSEKVVITPHPKEFASLLELADLGKFDASEVQKNRFNLAQIFSRNFKCVLVLKGANTLIAQGGEVYVMTHGSAALAKGGSGDALSGIIAGLLAQGYSPLNAAISGTLAHALAAREIKINDYALTAADVIKGLKCLRKK
ncbi:NAD(P)H-hydrate dehydratase, partial [uncultured Campylobacter sp.]|uniref:NAD(P)H-hydrate dehydratase n=1 Tax=uncultured Campylobacter sp. TaxID=218934 RepID=UPI00261B77EA